jgi:PadR family transcriptional regulator, regulatory protein PadR
MANKEGRIDLLQGTLDAMILRILSTMGPQHSYGISGRLEQISGEQLSLNQGTLYPALVRLEQNGWIKGNWEKTESNREAKYYSLTKSGVKALQSEIERWQRSAGLVNKVLLDKV